MERDMYLDQLIRQEIEAFIKVHSVIQMIFDSVEGQEDIISPAMLHQLGHCDRVIEWLVTISGLSQDEVIAIADRMNIVEEVPRGRFDMMVEMDLKKFNA